jgi:hypothetical protein
LNEPFFSNPLQDVKLINPGHADTELLAPMYERLYNEAYHKHAPESVMWFEANQVPDSIGVGGGLIFPVGFEKPPGGEIGSHYHILNDHTYCCAASASACANAEPLAANAELCKSYHDRKLEQRDKDAQRLGVPLFISEFGACLTEDNCVPELNSVLDAADRYQAGWAYWEFKKYADLTTTAGTGEEGFYEADGSLQHWKVKALARTYLQYSQGVPTKTEFSVKDHIYTAEIALNTDIEAPTVIYANGEYHYPTGHELEIKVDDVALTDDQYTITGQEQESNYTNLTITDKSLNGKTLQLKVMPRLEAIYLQ